jgi:hypothetical protein
MSPAELYSISFQNPEPSHFAMVPHIIDHLTYGEIGKDGKITTKRLSIYAKELYRVIKRIAGDSGACWMNRDHLAELCNMSAGSVTNAKKELLQKFNELDGKPLIILTAHKKAKVKDGIQKNCTVYHKLIVADIWKYNRAYMNTRKSILEMQALSPNDGAYEALSPNDGAIQGAVSPHDTKKNKINNNPLFNEQQPAPKDAPVCPLNSKDLSVSSLDTRRQAFNWFMKNGCDEMTALSFCAKYSDEEITNASGYVTRQIARKKSKGEDVPNIIGYLRKTLENKWWIPKNK